MDDGNKAWCSTIDAKCEKTMRPLQQTRAFIEYPVLYGAPSEVLLRLPDVIEIPQMTSTPW